MTQLHTLSENSDVPLDNEIDKLSSIIYEKTNTTINVEVQIQLARIVNYFPAISRKNDRQLIQNAHIAAIALINDNKNITLAREIIDQIWVDLASWPVKTYRSLVVGFRTIWRTSDAPVIVMFGLALFLYIVIPFLIWVANDFEMDKTTLGIPNDQITVVILFGALGSIISIMVRLSNYNKDIGRGVLFMTGAFRPIIGVSFALFIFAAFQSKLLPITLDSEILKSDISKVAFFAATSFVAGFSERIGRKVVEGVEGRIGGGRDETTGK